MSPFDEDRHHSTLMYCTAFSRITYCFGGEGRASHTHRHTLYSSVQCSAVDSINRRAGSQVTEGIFNELTIRSTTVMIPTTTDSCQLQDGKYHDRSLTQLTLPSMMNDVRIPPPHHREVPTVPHRTWATVSFVDMLEESTDSKQQYA